MSGWLRDLACVIAAVALCLLVGLALVLGRIFGQ